MKTAFPSIRSAALLAGLALVPGCERTGEDKGIPPPVPVEVGTVVPKDVPVEILSFGRVEASSTIQVKAQVGGELTEVFFQEGDVVKKGQHIFTLDPRPFEAALRQAEAVLDRDRAQLKNAEIEVRRAEKLISEKYAAEEDHDRAVANADALQATVRADEAAAEIARIRLGYCTIRSPVDGRVGKLFVYRGNLVKADSDTPLVTIVQTRPIRVSFSVPEKDLPRIRAHEKDGALAVEAIVPSDGTGPEISAKGTLTFIDNTVDKTTGTIALQATFENQDDALWPGQYVDARLLLEVLKAALTVPDSAIQVGQQGTFVFAVKEDSTVEIRPVTLRADVESASVVESGLQDGETVVTAGQLRLFPGARIEKKSREIRREAARP